VETNLTARGWKGSLPSVFFLPRGCVAGDGLEPAGHRRGRQSLGSDVTEQGEKIFRVHFDASDGKCSVRGLGIEHCVVLEAWDVRR
jgi:hypothetical protein